ncbi:MAG: DUF2961 domain-containing protein [Verrucomicrobiales bacterium]|nr:DUF2961 domain-containing protein [Verrucomicrobiales bacterium]
MTTRQWQKMAALALTVTAVTVSGRAATYTYGDLAARLTSLELLATPPADGELGALASSYDRKSQYDADSGQYLEWGANGDGGGFIREEHGQIVMAELEGPGVIWRTWSATAGDGRVKIYLDGAAEPAVDLRFKEYFDGRHAPFTRPLLVYRTEAQGLNNYTPIPFQKSCKIVAEPGWGNYYQFNYTKFPPGTVVPTFKLPLTAADEAALDRANAILANSGADPAGERAGAKLVTREVTVSGSGRAVAAEFTGSGAITALKVNIKDLPADLEARRALLAQLTVSAYWDGRPQPAVWSQLGDFFGAAAAPEPFRTLPAGQLDDGTFYCYWFMPFGHGAKIEVGNDGPRPVTMTWAAVTAPPPADVDKLLRFHAKWHGDAFLPATKDRAIDWTLLVTKGRGRFAGVTLHVWNPGGGWWGEGDEKFWVDGEKFPSTLGTGSEDYFGYAWCDWHRFVRPLHAQPVNEENEGHVDNVRWHIADNIPFQKLFEGAMEKYFRKAAYAAVAYWYLAADGEDDYAATPWAARAPLANPVVFHVPGAQEGEKLRVVNREQLEREKITAGGQIMDNPNWTGEWSRQQQLFWRADAVGQRLEVEFKAPSAGQWRVLARCTRAHDYGTVKFDVDGAAGAEWDGFAPQVSVGDETVLGEFTLTAGAHLLGVTVSGKHERSRGYLFGLDYIKLEPAK